MALETMALDYIRHLQSKLIDDDRQIYDRFSETLIQFIHGDIPPSIAVATISKLLHNHPDLLHAFRRFTPTIHSAITALAAKHSDSDVKATLDFLHQAKTRLAKDGVVYSKFLDCVKSHNRREISLSELCCEVNRLLWNHPVLMVHFRYYLPDQFIQLQSFQRKRKRDDHGERSSPEPSTKKERSISKKESVNFDMENELFEIEVEISNLTATHKAAVNLKGRLCDGCFSPAELCLDDHFTPLNLACIRRIYKKSVYKELLEKAENQLSAVEELINKLLIKKEDLEKSKTKTVEQWNQFRHSL